MSVDQFALEQERKKDYATAKNSFCGFSDAATYRQNHLVSKYMKGVRLIKREPPPELTSDKLEKIFSDLVESWKQDTEYLSSITDICMHPDYQKIIGLGERALPLIFRELEENPDNWFWALAAITREDVLSDLDRESFDSMVAAWLRFGKKRKYI